MRRIGLLAAALLMPAAQGHAQDAQERIDKGTAAFEEAFNAGDAAAAAQFYTDDAMVLPPGGSPVSGKDAIVAYFQEVMDAGVTDLDLETVDLVQAGDVAIQVATFDSAQPDGSRGSGKLLLVLQPGSDGTWRVHRVMWNTDSPAE